MKIPELIVVIVLGLGTLIAPTGDADALESTNDCGAESTRSQADATNKVIYSNGGLQASGEKTTNSSTTSSAGCTPSGTFRYEPMCGEDQTGGICEITAHCGRDGMVMRQFYTPVGGLEEDRGLRCLDGGVATPAITQRIVLRALKRITLPKPKMIVQPPGGKTLVNFDTLFHTEADTINRSIRLLGKRVDLEITPSSYTWHHGDHTTQTSTSPGIEYESDLPMSSYISHQYVDAHVTVHPSVDVSYTARYRVDRGAWMTVEGTVTRSGPAVDLRIVEGRPVLLGR